MAHALAQVVLARDSALPEDVFVNTFHFDTGPDTVLSRALNIAGAVEDFYTLAHPDSGGQALQSRLASTLANGAFAHRIKVYDMGAPLPRAPIADIPFTITPSSSGPFAHEVAVCLSFSGDLVSGLPQARRRGRVYIGPIANLGTNVAADGRVATSLCDFVVRAGMLLRADTETVWCAYSRVGGTLTPVTKVWCDNAWDTQRRRGDAPTLRVANP